MPPARWPSFERILEIDKIYTSTTSQIGKLSRVEEHEVEPLSVLPPELMDVIKRKLGCADYFRLKQTSHENNNRLLDHYCEKIKTAALEAIVQVQDSNPSPKTIDLKFVTGLNDTFLKLLEGEGGGGTTMALRSIGDEKLFDILEIVGYADPEKLQGTSFKFTRGSMSDEQTKGLCRVLCIKGLNVQTVDLTVSLDVRQASQLSAAALGNPKMEKFNEIPIKDMRTNSSTKLDLSGKEVGVVGGMVVAGLLPVMASLTSIDLSHNDFGPEGAEALAPAIAFNPSMTECTLRGNHLGVEGWTTIFNALCDSPASRISTWDLSGERLGPEIAEPLANYIYVTASLTSIDLEHNQLGAEGVKALAPALRDSPSLASIDLYNNNLGAEGAKALAPALRDSASVTCLDVRHNGISGDGASQLSAAVLGNPKMENFNEIPIKEMRANSLIELDLSGKEVGVVGCMVVAGLLPVMASLTNISLARSKLGEEGSKIICSALKSSSTMTDLDLSGSPVFGSNIGGAAGAKHVAEMLKVTGSLTSINLQYNNLGSEGAKALAPGLRGRASLTSINLEDNDLGPEGAKALAPAIRDSASLTRISLSYNHLGSKGAKALAPAIRESASLKKIDLSCNYLFAEGAKALAPAIRDSASLTWISLYDNRVGVEGEALLREAVEGRPGIYLLL